MTKKHKKKLCICIDCGRKRHNYGHKRCANCYKKQYRKEHRDLVLQQEKKYRESHKAQKAKIAHKYNRSHVADNQARKKKYREENYQKINEYEHEYYRSHYNQILEKNKRYYRKHIKTNIQFRLAASLRKRLIRAISREWKSGSAVRDLGCTIPQLKLHLESQWLPGMTWDNWGKGPDKWQIHHIIPLHTVNLSNREEFLRVNHYTNLQPLWYNDHIKKHGGG